MGATEREHPVPGEALAGSGIPMAKKPKTTMAVRASRVRSRLLFVIFDALWIFASYGFAEVTYFRDKAPGLYWQHFSTFFLLALTVTLIANHVFGLYDRMWRHAGAEEAHQLALSAAVVLCFLILIYPLKRTLRVEVVPVTVILVGWVFATAGMGLIRFHSRVFAWQRGSRRVGLRVGIVGSRDAGAAAIREMLRNPNAGLVPVAVFDDDAKAHGLSMVGVPVVGSIEDIPVNASRYTLQQVLLAIPNPSPALVEKVLQSCEKADLNLRILPSMSHIFKGSDAVSSLRQARAPRDRGPPGPHTGTHRPGQRTQVLREAPGAGDRGRRIHRIGDLPPGGRAQPGAARPAGPRRDPPARHRSHAEGALPPGAGRHHRSIGGQRDLRRFRPDVVFHAAGHKHVPVLEKHPVEAVTTNVFGTLNVVEAAVKVGVSRFVQISSDKAVRPTSVMGATKWFAEQIMLSALPGRAVLLHGPVRQRAREPGQCDPDVHPPDRQRRAGHGDRRPG